MTSYFDKLKKAAQQSLNILTNAANDFSINLAQNQNSVSAADTHSNQDDLLKLFHAICEIIDGFADLHAVSPMESDKLLHSSKVPAYLQQMLQLLQREGDDWLARYESGCST
jgi:hypothetical protein